MRHLVYNVRYSVVPIDSSLLTITLYSSVITTLVYNDAKFSPLHDVINEFDSTTRPIPLTFLPLRILQS
jgi:hypothetical protein